MSCTVTLTAKRWEFQFGLISQLEYWPVLTRWRDADEHGFMFCVLCLIVRYGADNR